MEIPLLTILTVVAALQLAHCSVFPRQTDEDESANRDITANIDGFFDIVVKNLAGLMVKNNLDPFPLPDQMQKFAVKDLIHFTWHGELGLSNGSLSNLSDLKRIGNATLRYKGSVMTVNATVQFRELMMQYNYQAQFMNLGPKGKVSANVTELEMKFTADIEMSTMKAKLVDFHIVDASKIKVKFEGLWLLDYLVETFANIVTSLFRKTIIYIVEGKVRPQAEAAVASIDLTPILG